MKLKVLEQTFSVCQVKEIDSTILNHPYTFYAKTEEEISIVCEQKITLDNTIKRVDGWKCIKIEGVLDFSLLGILANISKILADAEISIFVVSTYNTDYILVREANIDKAIHSLKENGYQFI